MTHVLLRASAIPALLVLGCAQNSTSPAPTPATSQWVQVWSDEFDGAAGSPVDGTKWKHDLGDGCQNGICGWGNNEKEWYTNAAENVALNGQGQLAIVARVAPPGMTCYYGPCRYTSGKITTRGTMDAQPGRVEARIKLAPGQGLWPAFWMLGHGDPTKGWPDCGEIDVMENKGSQPRSTSSALHGPGYSGGNSFWHVETLPTGSFTSEFHVFAVEWDANGVVFFIDGTAHFAMTKTYIEGTGAYVFNQPFYVILNMAVGGHFDGDPQSDAIFPATMLVDYVRVFRKS